MLNELIQNDLSFSEFYIMIRRRRTLVKDTPEKSGLDVTIVEDSVFDTSQVRFL